MSATGINNIKPCFEAVREKKLFQCFITPERVILKAGKLLSGRLRFKHHITASERDLGRVWSLYDALVDSSVLHPLHNDIKIAPFGEMSDCWIHIRWIGWDRPGTSKTVVRPEKSGQDYNQPEVYTRLRMMLQVLESVKALTENVKKEGTGLLYRLNSVPYSQRSDLSGFAHEFAAFERRFNEILQGTVQELLPFSLWQHRGLMPLPFRLITIRDYNQSPYSPVKLSPSEARRLAHFLKIWIDYRSRDERFFHDTQSSLFKRQHCAEL